MSRHELDADERYLAWKRERARLEPGPGFADAVMQHVRGGRASLPADQACKMHTPHRVQRVLQWIGTRAWAQAAAIALTTAVAAAQALLLMRIGIG